MFYFGALSLSVHPLLCRFLEKKNKKGVAQQSIVLCNVYLPADVAPYLPKGRVPTERPGLVGRQFFVVPLGLTWLLPYLVSPEVHLTHKQYHVEY